MDSRHAARNQRILRPLPAGFRLHMSGAGLSKALLIAVGVFGVAVGRAATGEDIPFLVDKLLDPYWIVEKKVAPRYPDRALSRGESGCVAVGYIIEPDGSTSHQRAIVAYPSAVFRRSAIKAAKYFRYTPGERNATHEPVATLNVFTYEIVRGFPKNENHMARSALAKLCKNAAIKSLNAYAGNAGAG